MKSILFITAVTLIGLGSGITFISPAWAESPSINLDHDIVAETVAETVPETVIETGGDSASTPLNADVLLVEPRGLEVTASNEDAETLDDVANQINQVIEVDSQEFLPDGVIVRGSEGSLQLGSEI